MTELHQSSSWGFLLQPPVTISAKLLHQRLSLCPSPGAQRLESKTLDLLEDHLTVEVMYLLMVVLADLTGVCLEETLVSSNECLVAFLLCVSLEGANEHRLAGLVVAMSEAISAGRFGTLAETLGRFDSHRGMGGDLIP